MIDLDGIRKVLKSSKIYVKENSKNFVCSCPYCGDHRNPEKRGHLYVSKDESIPVSHCWYCNGSWPINKLLFDLTGKQNDKLIKVESKDYKKSVRESASIRCKKLKVPKLDCNTFVAKTNYMKVRTFGKIDIEAIPNLIFDSNEFFKINSIDPIKDLALTAWEVELLQHNFVIFLSVHNTMLYCRNINKDSDIQFRKIFLQRDQDRLLDYYSINLHHPDSNIIVLSEGNFDILGCYVYDSLGLNNKINCYASGCTFSYAELLKSVCYDRSLYNAEVYVLSDNDKQEWHYRKFLKTAYTASKVQIVYNKFGKDFGMINQQYTKVF